MDLFEVALLGGAAYLILSGGSAGSAETSGVGGWGSSPAPASLPPVSTPKQITLSGQNVPGTTSADLGKISVRSAPLATNPPEVIAEVKQIFQTEYLKGNFVPSSALSGKLTKTDIIIAQNLAKKSFKI